MSDTHVAFDALLPLEMAKKAEDAGVAKARLGTFETFMLAVLAGAFIALGAIFATTVTTGSTLPFGVTKLLGGLVFCLGLILVVIAGAELFTGNNLIVIAWANGRVKMAQLLRNWGIVYVGNFVGSVLTALGVFLAGQYEFGGGEIGRNAIAIGQAKVGYSFLQAFMLGVLCNALVCLAVWLCMSARTVTDKVLAIIFPITAFVAAGFEHSVANMYFVPFALFVKSWGGLAADAPTLTWSAFLINNLLPVTLGNIVGGAGLVGLVYRSIYLRRPQVKVAGPVA